MKTIYLSGAMEVYGSTNQAREWRDEVKAYFADYSTNFECFSPADYYSYGDSYHKSQAEIMRFELRKIKECDVVLVNLANIRKSIGTSDEVLYAYLLGKPIIGFIEEGE